MDDPQALRAAIDQLDRDPRPSFIVDLTNHGTLRSGHFPVIHCNPALANFPDVVAAVTRPHQEVVLDCTAVKFRCWITRVSAQVVADARISLYDFRDVFWSLVPLPANHLLISGLPKHAIDHPVDHVDVSDKMSSPVTLKRMPTSSSILLNESQNQGQNGHNFEQSLSFGRAYIEQQPYIDLFNTVDWAKTSLGPIEQWCEELRVLAKLVLADPQPAFLFLGEEFLTVYNAASAAVLPDAQGVFMGSTPKKIFPAGYPPFEKIFRCVFAEREPQIIENAQMAIARNSRLEERFFNLHFLPILDGKGNCLGIYETAREVTKENLSQRRLSTLLEISTCASGVRDQKIYWSRLLEAMAGNKEDIGFALLYSLENTSEAKADVLKQEVQSICTLEGTLGLPEDSSSKPSTINLTTDTSGYSLGFNRALEIQASVILDAEDHPWLIASLDGIACRGYSAPCQGVVVCPIRPTGGAECVAFLVIGLSSRIVLDDELKHFVEILNRHIDASIASVLLFEEEISRERQRLQDAALVHAKLQERLTLENQQLLSVEAKFERMTDCMPIAVCVTDPQGMLTYANQAFYTTTGHSGSDVTPESWIALIHQDDRELTMAKFGEVWLTGRVQFEVRLEKRYTRKLNNTDTISTSIWLLVAAYLDIDKDGQPQSLVSSMTDISDQKWAERLQHMRMVEALEAKKQQEEFIDTVSHEIRNPLSAILQSVDEITDYHNLMEGGASLSSEQLQGSLDAVKTITFCCQHQRRVVDDILLLSKIKSQMLTVCAVKTNVPKLIETVTTMFSTELKASNIVMSSKMGPILTSGEYNELMIDSSRVLQVLVNLISNAIKFTRGSADRRIEILCTVHTARPSTETYDIKYMVPHAAESNDEQPAGHTKEDQVYLHFIVRDTGIGMTNEQKNILFTRFSQATPRTHIRYGGSGLGLFICKQLCELQGGSIGLKMMEDKGTTIGFFVKASKPQHDHDDMARDNTRSSDLVAGLKIQPVSEKVPALPIRLNNGTPTAIAPNNATLLVVEDNLVNQRVMCKHLQRQGFTVHKANNGLEALEFLETTTIWKGGQGSIELSLILLDIEMPIMDGLVCVSRIRQLEAAGTLLVHVPVIAVSANARDEQIEEARSAGMDDNVCKPFRINDLVVKIHALLAAR